METVNLIDETIAPETTENLEGEVTTPAGLSPDDSKVMELFKRTLNTYIQKVGNFSGSKAQLQRVLINLALSPINDGELKFGYPEEKELFDMGNSVAGSKFFFMLSGLAEQGKIKFVEEAVTSPETTEEKVSE